MRNRKMAALVGAVLVGLVVGCGEVFVAGPGTGGAGGGGAGPAGGGGSGAQGGSAGASTSDGGGAACEAPQSGDACEECLFGTCEAAYCDCVDEPDCPAIGTCLAQGNPIEICWQKYPDGVAIVGRLQACGAASCGACSYPAVEPCLACQYEHCQAEVNNCFSLGACLGYLGCFNDCKMAGGNDFDCNNQCYSAHQAGVPAAQDLVKCIAGECPEPCNL